MNRQIKIPKEKKPTRDDKGRWLPGQSGNLGGSVSAFKRRLRMMAAPHIEALYLRTVKEAASGERWAMELYWREIVPLAFGKATQPLAVAVSDAADKIAEMLLDIAPEYRDEIADRLEEVLDDDGHQVLPK